MIDIGYAGALLGGVLTLLSPCSAVLLPAFFAYAFTSGTTLVGRTAIFYLGLLTTLVPLGVAASSLGGLLVANRGTAIAVVSTIIIVFGLMQILGIQLPWPQALSRSRPGANPKSVLSVYLLGAGYGMAGVCSGPILGSVLAVAALGSDPLYGGILLAVYALGMIIPVLLLATFWDRFQLGQRSWIKPRGLSFGPIRTTSTGIIAGLLFVGIGVLMLTTAGTADLGGILTIDTQYAAEVGLQKWTSRVPDLLVVALIVILLGVAGFVGRRYRRRSSTKETQHGRA